jgi:hypothetical protein
MMTLDVECNQSLLTAQRSAHHHLPYQDGDCFVYARKASNGGRSELPRQGIWLG